MLTRSVFLVPTVLAAAAMEAWRIDGWFNCSANTIPSWNERHNTMQVTVECALVELPLCYPSMPACSSDRLIQVFVKRILGNATTVNKDVWVLQGGPGASSVAMEYMMLDLFTTTNGTANIYTMDHRGTGRSHPLECVAAQASTSGSVDGEVISVQELPSCIRDVLFQIDGQTEAFSVTSAATDLFMLSDGLRASSSHQVFVYGASYGTLLVERAMQLEPGHIRGYVLDGVVAQVNHSFAQFDHDINAAGRRFLDRCASNVFCHSRFPDVVTGKLPLSHVVQRIYERLDARHPGGVDGSLCWPLANWTDTPPSHGLRRFLTTLLMNVNLRTMIPAVIYRLHRCTRQDDRILTFLQRKIQKPTGRHGSTVVPTHGPVGGDPLLDLTPMLYNLIVFSEEWTYPTPSQADLRRYFESQPFGLGVFDLVPAYCVATNYEDPACHSHRPAQLAPTAPFTYARDAYFNQTSTIPPDASVLFLSGTLDPQTEIHHGRAQFAALNGTQKRWIEFLDAPHCTAFQTPMFGSDIHCGVYVVASFVMGDGDLQSVNTSCMAERVPLSFKVPPKMAMAYFGTPDAFDGELHLDRLIDISVALKAAQPSAMAHSNTAGAHPDVTVVLGSVVCLAVALLALAGIVVYRHQKTPADAVAAVMELANLAEL